MRDFQNCNVQENVRRCAIVTRFAVSCFPPSEDLHWFQGSEGPAVTPSLNNATQIYPQVQNRTNFGPS